MKNDLSALTESPLLPKDGLLKSACNAKHDFHCHSNYSDGELSFDALISKAQNLGLQQLAITDHDTIAGYQKLSIEQNPSGALQLFTGVEISCRWANADIHIVGLDFDINNTELVTALAQQNNKRDERAERMGQKLAKLGIEGALLGAKALANGGAVGRPHFAQFLVNNNHAKDLKQAFDRYLGQGKSCYQVTEWPDVAEAIGWIKAANGKAVMAHPTRYKMTATKLRNLVAYFAENGGQALEFIGGSGSKDTQQFIASLCKEHNLLASAASDFHSEKQVWQQLGRTGEIPRNLRGIWQDFGEPFAVFD